MPASTASPPGRFWSTGLRPHCLGEACRTRRGTAAPKTDWAEVSRRREKRRRKPWAFGSPHTERNQVCSRPCAALAQQRRVASWHARALCGVQGMGDCLQKWLQFGKFLVPVSKDKFVGGGRWADGRRRRRGEMEAATAAPVAKPPALAEEAPSSAGSTTASATAESAEASAFSARPSRDEVPRRTESGTDVTAPAAEGEVCCVPRADCAITHH